MELWERVIEGRLRKILKTKDNQHGFQKDKSTMEPIFRIKLLQ